MVTELHSTSNVARKAKVKGSQMGIPSTPRREEGGQTEIEKINALQMRSKKVGAPSADRSQAALALKIRAEIEADLANPKARLEEVITRPRVRRVRSKPTLINSRRRSKGS